MLLLSGTVVHLVLCVLVHLLLLGEPLVRVHHWSATWNGILAELRLCSNVAAISPLSNHLRLRRGILRAASSGAEVLTALPLIRWNSIPGALASFWRCD